MLPCPASLLYESVLVQRAIANGSSVAAITPSPLNPTIAFVPATTDVWVNGLWFTSLFLSLTTALRCCSRKTMAAPLCYPPFWNSARP